ncbi:MAG: DsrE family protein [Betaproteobacteria bacterium]|nr:DsrE family protein [Betaproteobacteria bacterium]
MLCVETNRLLHGYLDGELDLASALALEDHLRECAACRERFTGQQALRSAVTGKARYHAAPAGLRQALRTRLAAEGRTRIPAWLQPWPATAMAAAALLIAVTAWVTVHQPPAPTQVAQAPAERKLVYHVNSSDDVATAFRNLSNLLDAAPRTRVVVVAHNSGVDFLISGARDKAGDPYQPAVAQLKSRGVDFRICGNTLGRRNIQADRVIPEAVLVPSGIVEIARLQAEEGYSYIKL